MSRSDAERLKDARQYLSAVTSAFDEYGMDTIWASRERRQSLLLDLILFGEALGKIAAEVKSLAPRIPWAQISWTRNRLVHVYWLQEREFIARLIANELPSLGAELDRLAALLDRAD